MWARVIVAFILFLLPATSFAQTEKRIALLIGNRAYDASVGVLKNPHNDVAVVGEALSKQGFEVLPPLIDVRRSAILGGVRELARKLNAGGTGAVGFLYYSGHGAAEKDTNINYLIPVDAKEPGSPAFWDESLKLDDILKLLDGARSAAKFIVFDACRNELQLPTKDTTKGLIPVAEQQGMFIAYASAPGRTASDRGAKSGPYAEALAAELGKPGVDHLSLFQNVKEAVYAASGGAQQPWESNGLLRRIYLSGRPTPSAPPQTSVAPTAGGEATEAWTIIKDTTSIPALEAYSARFKDSIYADLARQRIEELKKQRVGIVASPSASSSSRYPDAPIKIIVPYSAGGTNDVVGRIVAEQMQKSLGQPVTIQNVAGAGGSTGSVRVAKEKPDGLYLLLGNTVTHAISPSLSNNLQYDPIRDFELVALLAETPLVVIANKVPSAENNLKALIDHKASSFAATARGSVSHLGCVLLNSATGISARHIAYLDSASALKGVAEGVIDYACVELSSAGPSLTTRTIQAVAVLGKERFPTLPNIRTANEQGLNDFEAVNWYALFAPKGTPPAIIEKLRTVVAGALDGANVKDRLREMGLVVVGGERSTTPYLARFISSEIAKWAAPAKASE